MNDGKSRLAAVVLSLLLCAAFVPRAWAEDRRTEPAGLVPVGHTVGVKLFADGVMVVGLSEGNTPAKACGLRRGDIMLRFNGAEIESTEHFQQLLTENGEAKAAMSVRRGGELLTLPVTPEKTADGRFRLGAWIRDSMAGIGTVTFYDPGSGVFGALGHGVTDVDTGMLMPLQSGSVMDATVKAVKRGESGDPGELRGDFNLSRDSGSLYANTDCGLFGRLSEQSNALGDREPVPIMPRAQVRPGPAVILANCEGDEVREYAAVIERVYSGDSPTRNLLLRVTDEALLSRTGGIVQGMSGAPILQDGKLAGAVTHVLVSEPSRGYGIFIENMLSAAGLAEQ